MTVMEKILELVFENLEDKNAGVKVQLLLNGSAQPMEGALRPHPEIEGALELATPAMLEDGNGNKKMSLMRAVFPPEAISALIKFEEIEQSGLIQPGAPKNGIYT